VRRLGCIILTAATSCSPSTLQSSQSALGWTDAGPLSVARGLFTCQLVGISLSDGTAMFPGGVPQGGGASKTVDVFRLDGGFSAAASFNTGHTMAALLALPDGGALVSGGGYKLTATGPLITTTAAERWDPSGTWLDAGTLQVPRNHDRTWTS